METRFNMQQLQPQAFKAMLALEGYLQTTQLDKMHKELIKLRSSQLNGCAFCLDMHFREATKLGETPQRIVLLSAWREADIFTDEEKTILALTEAVTLIHQGGISAALYQKAVGLFGEMYVAQAIMAIVTINSWNRIAISTLQQPVS